MARVLYMGPASPTPRVLLRRGLTRRNPKELSRRFIVKKSVIGSALVLGFAVAIAGPSLGGCGNNPGGTSGSGGSQAPGLESYGKISTLLTLPGGETITSVNWTINQ